MLCEHPSNLARKNREALPHISPNVFSEALRMGLCKNAA
jgi:hypothetical protein